MSTMVPPLAVVLVTLPDFRANRGKRHPLTALLLLACTAMLCGARGESAIAEWAANYPGWRGRLGFTHPLGPSQSTIQRLFLGLDVGALEARLTEWVGQVLIVCPPAPDALPFEAMAIGAARVAGATNIAAACRRYAAQPALALAALGLNYHNE